ncbi:ABC transporter ATP-binding protein [Rhodoplanes elegans]|uniref:ABC transporter ATP-binding protein n=1 Tax=Rhodoplanes elegans TaxID=29408 RepID=A0A327KTH7_9BRAD|nr:ABC transporter ATP-binding protein [Rhodoplanes elegans]MBK5960444.1 ABC transporter ATP-binding protein [Rhodoplanes elegans]RAI42119.1 ABC transporter ATP-binding protein [Rhodoplanes elegans]
MTASSLVDPTPAVGAEPRPAPADAILAVDDVSVSYGRVEAVRRVSLTIPRGGIVTIIGANGAGKTTLLNAIAGVLPAAGSIRLDGRDIAGEDVETRVGDGLCLVPEKRELFPTMSVEDNLRLGAWRLGSRAAGEGLAGVFERFPRLKERRRQHAGTLSGGERQMLAMGRALMGRPRVLMLDEPSLGLAPRIVKDVLRIVTDLRQTGVSILLVEQNARAALQVADYAYVMELGEITIHGPAAELAQDRRVIDSYLGLGARH